MDKVNELVEMAKAGNVSAVEALLADGVDPTASAEDDSALTIAAWNGDTKILASILKTSPDVDSVDRGHWTALGCAASKGNIDAIRMLLAAGADPNKPTSDQGSTPLTKAAIEGQLAAVKALLKAGANADPRNATGCSPLFLAAGNGHADVMRVLVKAGAEINAQNEHGTTPLMYAASQGQAASTKALLDAGADPNFETKAGTAMLHATTSDNGTMEVVLMLKQAGAGSVTDGMAAMSRHSAVGEPRQPSRSPDQQAGEPPVDVITNSIGMRLALIPAGQFLMWDPPSQKSLAVEKPFYMGIYPVTQPQYQKIMGTNPSYYTTKYGDTTNSPVEQVTWAEATEFCQKLSAQEPYDYRLPTEAEWEYACRAGTTSDYYFGDSLSTDQALFSTGPVMLDQAMRVGAYPPNAFGLHDMHGLVFEWCSDEVDDRHAMRGGGWQSEADDCRSAASSAGPPDFYRSAMVGFRVVREVEQAARLPSVEVRTSKSGGKPSSGGCLVLVLASLPVVALVGYFLLSL
jgi:formylglycine-generating enzyme required for sulfatase activity